MSGLFLLMGYCEIHCVMVSCDDSILHESFMGLSFLGAEFHNYINDIVSCPQPQKFDNTGEDMEDLISSARSG